MYLSVTYIVTDKAIVSQVAAIVSTLELPFVSFALSLMAKLELKLVYYAFSKACYIVMMKG